MPFLFPCVSLQRLLTQLPAVVQLENCTLRSPEQAKDYPNWAQCHGSPRWIMARNATTKLVYRVNGESELYDSANDPKELNNLYNDPAWAPVRDSMTARLLRFLFTTSDTTPLTVDPRGFPGDQPPPL